MKVDRCPKNRPIRHSLFANANCRNFQRKITPIVEYSTLLVDLQSGEETGVETEELKIPQTQNLNLRLRVVVT